MIPTNLNMRTIVLYLRSWKEGKRVLHARRAVPCTTRTYASRAISREKIA
jgi:hypothetical protein